MGHRSHVSSPRCCRARRCCCERGRLAAAIGGGLRRARAASARGCCGSTSSRMRLAPQIDEPIDRRSRFRMWYDPRPFLHALEVPSSLRVLVFLRPRPAVDRDEGAHRRERRRLPRADRSLQSLTDTLGPRPGVRRAASFWVWQLGTYMFLHGGLDPHPVQHAGAVDVRDRARALWGTRYFLKFYFVTGIGAGMLTVLFSLLPFGVVPAAVSAPTSSARPARSTACCWRMRLYFPDRPIYMYFLFPIPAKIFVLIMGAIAFYASVPARTAESPTPRIWAGCSCAYLYLKRPRIDPCSS